MSKNGIPFTPEQLDWLRDNLAINIKKDNWETCTEYTIVLYLNEIIIDSATFSVDKD